MKAQRLVILSPTNCYDWNLKAFILEVLLIIQLYLSSLWSICNIRISLFSCLKIRLDQITYGMDQINNSPLVKSIVVQIGQRCLDPQCEVKHVCDTFSWKYHCALGAWQHLVGPKQHSFQSKVVNHSFCPENVEKNYFFKSKIFTCSLLLIIPPPFNAKQYTHCYH